MTNFIFSFLPRVESDRSHWIDDDLTEGFPLLFWNDQSSRAPKTERVRDSARPCFFTCTSPYLFKNLKHQGIIFVLCTVVYCTLVLFSQGAFLAFLEGVHLLMERM